MPHRAGNPLSNTGPVVAEVFEWEDAPTEDLKAWIEQQRANRPAGKMDEFSGSRAADPDPTKPSGIPAAFIEHCKDVLDKMQYGPIKEYRYWFGVTLPYKCNAHEPRFAHGFPHAHNWDALTLIHYVQTADEGGDLVLVEPMEHDTLHRFTVKAGQTVVVDGYSLHGVEQVFGKTPRYTLLCTAWHDDGVRGF
jgi:hypothetical protein